MQLTLTLSLLLVLVEAQNVPVQAFAGSNMPNVVVSSSNTKMPPFSDIVSSILADENRQQAAMNDRQEKRAHDAELRNEQLINDLLGEHNPLLHPTRPSVSPAQDDIPIFVQPAQRQKQESDPFLDPLFGPVVEEPSARHHHQQQRFPDHAECKLAEMYPHLASLSIKHLMLCCVHFQLACASQGQYHKSALPQTSLRITRTSTTATATTTATTTGTTTTTRTSSTQDNAFGGFKAAAGGHISAPTWPHNLDDSWHFELVAAAVALLTFFLVAFCVRKYICKQKLPARSASVDGADIESTDSEVDEHHTVKGKRAAAGKRDTDKMTEDEFQRILSEAGQDEPLLALPAPAARTAWHEETATRAKAEAEVERVLGIRNPRELFGTGSTMERRAEFRRLARLLHPDKKLVSGERAALALRRVVEAAKDLQKST